MLDADWHNQGIRQKRGVLHGQYGLAQSTWNSSRGASAYQVKGCVVCMADISKALSSGSNADLIRETFGMLP